MQLELFKKNLKGDSKVRLSLLIFGILCVYLVSVIFGATIDSITLNSPVNSTFTNDNTTDFSINVTGNQSSYNCSIYLNHTSYGNNATTSNNTATVITSSEIPDGFYDWYSNCTAEGGTSQSEIREITIDTTSPTYSDNSTNSTYTEQDILHSLKWADTIGLNGYIFSFCNGTWNGTNCTGNETYTLKEYYNTNDDTQGAIYNTAWWGQTFNTSVSYDIKTVGVKVFKVGNPETVTISIYPTNATGEPDCSGSPLVLGSFNGSLITTSTPGEWVNATFDTAYTLSASTTYAITMNLTGDASNYIDWRLDGSSASYTGGTKASSNDGGTNWSMDAGKDMMFETYTSSAAGWANDSWVAMSGTLNWSNVTKSITSNVGVNVSWIIYANDTSGNENTSDTYVYITTSANTPPTVSSVTISPSTAYTNNNLECNATITDIDAGDVLTAYFKWYHNGTLNETGNFSSITNNTNTLISTLGSGNTTKGDEWICDITPYDSTENGTPLNSSVKTISNSAPTITTLLTSVSKDADGTVYTYDYNATDLDVDDGVDTLIWYDNTTLFNINSGTGIISDTPTESEHGTHSILINVSDGTAQDTDTFTYQINDTTFPLISYNPTTTTATNHSQTWIFINITASDTNKDSVLFEWNGTNETFTNNSGNVYWENKTSLSDGTYTINSHINDTAGNTNSTTLRTIILDTTPPTINITYPETTTYYILTKPATINYTIDDTADTCWFNINGTNTTFTCGNNSANITDHISSGSNTLTLYANDSLGNIGNDNVTFIYNDTVVSFSSPQPILDEQFTSTTISVTIGATTDTTGNCRYSASSGSAFADMTNFTNTNSTNHSSAISVSFGNNYNYYVKCNNSLGNINPSDYHLYFAVKSSESVGGSEGTGDVIVCGDGICDGDENVSNCPEDCAICGDGICSVGENLTNCPEDCKELIFNITQPVFNLSDIFDGILIYPDIPDMLGQFQLYLQSEIGETPTTHVKIFGWYVLVVILILSFAVWYLLGVYKEIRVNKYVKKE